MNMIEINNDYTKYRGKCKEMSEALVQQNPELRLVRGFYDCPVWGEQQHWWCEDSDGKNVDPTKNQFPSKGIGMYREFDGMVSCSNCGTEMHEHEVVCADGRYAFCSGKCYGRFVGVEI